MFFDEKSNKLNNYKFITLHCNFFLVFCICVYMSYTILASILFSILFLSLMTNILLCCVSFALCLKAFDVLCEALNCYINKLALSTLACHNGGASIGGGCCPTAWRYKQRLELTCPTESKERRDNWSDSPKYLRDQSSEQSQH